MALKLLCWIRWFDGAGVAECYWFQSQVVQTEVSAHWFVVNNLSQSSQKSDLTRSISSTQNTRDDLQVCVILSAVK